MAAKPKTVFLIGIVAVAIAAIASISLYNYLKGQEAKVKEAVATEEIVVAAQEIPAGSSINPAQVKTANWPKTSLPEGIFSKAEEVSGRVALERFSPGEPIIAARLVPKEGQAGILSYKIPEGHRAMTVGVDQVSGVAGFITPGNKVDVVLTTTPPGAKQSISKIVLQDVPVLAIGQIVDQKEGKPVAVPTVTMDVTPEDAENLAIASTQGRLQLVLRRAGDTEVAQTVGATVTKVMSGVRTVKAERAPLRRATAGKRPMRTGPKKEERRAAKTEVTKKPEEVVSVELWKSGHKSTENFKVEE
jgi:pilus assembly protein CpaB